MPHCPDCGEGIESPDELETHPKVHVWAKNWSGTIMYCCPHCGVVLGVDTKPERQE